MELKFSVLASFALALTPKEDFTSEVTLNKRQVNPTETSIPEAEYEENELEYGETEEDNHEAEHEMEHDQDHDHETEHEMEHDHDHEISSETTSSTIPSETSTSSAFAARLSGTILCFIGMFL